MLKSPVVADTSRNTPCVFFFFKFWMDCSCWFVLRCFRTPASPWNPLSHVCQWVYFLTQASGACCQTMKTKHAEKTGARKDPLQIASYISSSCLSSPRVSNGKKKRGWPNEVGDHTRRCRACWSAAKSIPRSFLEYIYIYIEMLKLWWCQELPYFQVLDGLQLLVCSAVFPDTRFKDSMKSAESCLPMGVFFVSGFRCLLPNHENETCWKNGGQKRPSSNLFIHFFKLFVKPASLQR